MSYPSPDQSGVEAARAKYAAAIEATEATRANLTAAKATAAEATAARNRLIRQAAGGATASAVDHQQAEAAEAEREAMAAVGRYEAILAQQEAAVRAADAAIKQAQALSHRPRLVAAISARADAAIACIAARAAQRQAEACMKQAHEVALAAFARGHAMPPGAPRGAVNLAAEFESALWADASPAALNTLLG